MIEKKDIEKLSGLSRIEIKEDEIEALMSDLDSVLGYVSEIQKVVTSDITPQSGQLRNVMREDGNAHNSNEFSEDILEEVPEKKDGYIKVKKIL